MSLDSDGKQARVTTAIGFGLISGLIQSDPSRRLEEVWPRAWQHRMFRKILAGSGSVDTKDTAARLALSVFPDAQIYGPRGGLCDGISDAICIALYGTTLNLNT